ncbi:hypothetical protein BGZ49_001473, partial [Haplosporangium sp. Z 27]
MNPDNGEGTSSNTQAWDFLEDLDLQDRFYIDSPLVEKEGIKLFVGVDEYDALANNSIFTGRNVVAGDYLKDKVKDIKGIESHFKVGFFAPLKQGCSIGQYRAVISKYCLTGITPAFRSGISSLTAAFRSVDLVELKNATLDGLWREATKQDKPSEHKDLA